MMATEIMLCTDLFSPTKPYEVATVFGRWRRRWIWAHRHCVEIRLPARAERNSRVPFQTPTFSSYSSWVSTFHRLSGRWRCDACTSRDPSSSYTSPSRARRRSSCLDYMTSSLLWFWRRPTNGRRLQTLRPSWPAVRHLEIKSSCYISLLNLRFA